MSTAITTPASGSPSAATTWESYRVLLQQQRADCIRRHALALAETATSVPDPVTVRRAADMAFMVDEIDAALDRIADGTFGRCTQCGVDIPGERLELRPFAAGCVACQASAR